MSLLAQVNQPNANRFYFALDTSPADPTVTAPAFEAIGTAANPVGTFSAQGDAVAGGIDMFNMKTSLGRLQWSMGEVGVAAGANSGNNFALFAYDDNGAFLSAPITVNRATGSVVMDDALAVAGGLSADSLIVGDGTEAGGALAQINGTAGLSRVFDAVYNRPVPGAEVLLSQFGPTGAPSVPLVPYTAAKTGLYTLTMEVTADTNGFSWTNGTSLIVGYLANQAPPFAIISDSFVACDSLANPAGLLLPSGFPGGVYPKDIVAVVNLTAGVTYVPTITLNPAGINLGATGRVRFFIQPLIA